MSRLSAMLILALTPLLLLPQQAEAGRVLHLISEIIDNHSDLPLSLDGDDVLRWLMAMLGLL